MTSLAIVPYYNATGDPSLNWMAASVSETLSSGIGQSAHLRLVSPDRLQQVLKDLHLSPESQLDPSTLKRIADFTGADTIVSGEYVKLGDQIRLNSNIRDLTRDTNIAITTDVASQKDLLKSLDSLAAEVRKKLSSNPDMAAELEGSSKRVPTNSVEALRAYDEGMQLERSGDNTKAVEKFEQATQDDPNFAFAFSRLADTYSRLGFDDKAEQASRRAVALSDNLSAADQYRIQASHARIVNDTAKAIDSYEKLTKVNPDDLDAQFALANLYLDASNFDAARARLKIVLNADSKNVDALLASGRVEVMANKPQAALDFLNRGLSYAIQFDNQEQKAAILQVMGIAYQGMDKPDDALKNLQEALDIRRKTGEQKGIAGRL